MSTPQKPRARRRPGKNTFTTRSGNTFKLNRSFADRFKARRDAKARRRAAYLATLPKNRFKRTLYRMHPKRVVKYWFSHDGAIMALKLTGIGIIVCFLLVVGLFAYFRKDLPNINDISGGTLPGSTNYYDRTGQVLLYQDYEDFKRVQIEGDKIGNNMKNATVAIEDKDFYKHGAFDIRGIMRAGFNDVFKKSAGRQGGSTISQQLVKLNQEWTADRSYTRKIKELILAVELEREYSKEDILNGYLNAAPYGPVQYGVQTAAQEYFGVDAKDLTVAQAAMLSAIPKSPNVYSPYGPVFSPEDLIGRMHYIIDQMYNQRMITKEQQKEAKAVDILATVKPQQPSKYDGIKAPYFVLAAKEEFITRFGTQTVKRGGWKVITTVDLNLQTLAEKAVNDGKKQILSQSGKQAAFVAEDNKTGQVVALVGGFDFRDQRYGEINYATQANISPGSSFKPYDYVTFIENNNAGAGSVLFDSKGPIPGYKGTCSIPPTSTRECPPGQEPFLYDYDNGFPGPVTLRYALGGSRNIPAVKAMLLADPNDPDSTYRLNSINKTIKTANALMGGSDGYRCLDTEDIFAATKKDETQCFSSSAIGDGAYLHLDDHANGIASISRLGRNIPKTYIMEITNSNNKSFYKFEQPTGKQVVRPDSAYIVTDMASDPRASYLPGSCNENNCTLLRNFGYKFHRYNGWHFAVKTGTTNFGYDGLMASWSTKYTAVTWVGVNERNPAHRMRGAMETMTEPIVRAWMEGAHKDLKAENWKKPSGVKTMPAFVMSRKVSRLGEQIPGPSNDLFPSWYTPPKVGNTSATIDMVSNKLATSCTPDLAKKSQGGNSNANAFSVDTFVTGSGGSASSSATDDVHNCNDEKPSVTLSGPSSCEDETDCIFTVTYTEGTHPISSTQYPGTINLIINGQKVDTKQVSDSFGTVNFAYKPPSPSTATVQAQVIDSVLYSAATSTSVEFTPP